MNKEYKYLFYLTISDEVPPIVPTKKPVNSGLGGAAIFGIIFVCIILSGVFIGGIIQWRSSNFSSPFNKKTATPAPDMTQQGGFDNPINTISGVSFALYKF